ncbi:HD domain-containing protein [Lacticigenium naphthae]|uniref:HD domain-containing protein n=1 Tax=Lacticigenium naphthae TaxID=515351 RepID=UPI0003FED49C|nr:HD domain-containing protein [Lacticigenium naphthae]
MTTMDILIDLQLRLKPFLQKDTTGHDWYHTLRVYNTALQLSEEEHADKLITGLAALLHDVADHKFGYTDSDRERILNDWLSCYSLDGSITKEVIYIVNHISFKRGTNTHKMQTIEGAIVQDADRLDAIGAVGIARAFAYGGSEDRPLYDPDGKTVDEQGTIGHFYEKLLLLKDRMNTEAGKKRADHFHKTMETFLQDFYAQWDGEDLDK